MAITKKGTASGTVNSEIEVTDNAVVEDTDVTQEVVQTEKESKIKKEVPNTTPEKKKKIFQ